MIRVSVVAIALALAGCAAQPQVPKFTDEQQKTFSQQYGRCIAENVATLDDHSSDARTIAIAVAATCYPQYHVLAESYAGNLRGQEAPLMFMRRAENDPARIDSIVPMVLKERNQKPK